jgi:adenylosuccinate synthase
VDILSAKYDVVARVAGGSNAGHTIYVEVSEPIHPHHHQPRRNGAAARVPTH